VLVCRWPRRCCACGTPGPSLPLIRGEKKIFVWHQDSRRKARLTPGNPGIAHAWTWPRRSSSKDQRRGIEGLFSRAIDGRSSGWRMRHVKDGGISPLGMPASGACAVAASPGRPRELGWRHTSQAVRSGDAKGLGSF
jgi:hypothetical protein